MPAKDTITLSSSLDNVELQTVALQSPLNRTMVKDSHYTEEYVETSKGQVLVAWAGDRTKPAILTYHDLGLNYISNFQAFFHYRDMAEIVQQFCVFHVNAPGQEEGAHPLPESMEYPTMEELSEQINDVLNHFSVVRYIGIGVGLGGNVLLRHALHYPERADCLMLVNTSATQGGWIEYFYQKRNMNHLRNHGVTQAVMDYLMWHHFGCDPEQRAHDLVSMYRHYFNQDLNAKNLAKLIDKYIWRDNINIARENTPEQRGDSKTLQVPVLNLAGFYSPFLDDTVTLNGKLSPDKTNWMKIQDAAMILEEQPGKICEAFRLFLQGQGYCLNLKKNALGAVF